LSRQLRLGFAEKDKDLHLSGDRWSTAAGPGPLECASLETWNRILRTGGIPEQKNAEIL